jgi:Mn2+/Fe2+ NRAMP family transporter
LRVKKSFKIWLLSFLAVFGPGFIVMIADMDAGSITTAFVSGAQYGYKLIPLQLLLIPLLYVVQEIASRLGCVTSKGHGELIREYFGEKWAVFSTILLLFVVFSALLTEFSGIAASTEIIGIPKDYSIIISALLLIFVALSGKYKRAEAIAIVFSLVSFVFIPAAIMSHPNYTEIAKSFISHQPFNNKNYLFLIAANVGAVIMPWMIYYQQSATVDKRLQSCDIKFAKWDTLIGSFATQILMIVVIILGASVLYKEHIAPNNAYNFALALVPIAGKYSALLFAVGLYASSILAAFVVSMSFAWASGETWNFGHTLNANFKQEKMFYFIYIALVALSAIIILIPGIPLVKIMVDVEAFNGFVLPIVLGFLIMLASSKKILKNYSYSRAYISIVALLALAIIVLGIYSVIV